MYLEKFAGPDRVHSYFFPFTTLWFWSFNWLLKHWYEEYKQWDTVDDHYRIRGGGGSFWSKNYQNVQPKFLPKIFHYFWSFFSYIYFHPVNYDFAKNITFQALLPPKIQNLHAQQWLIINSMSVFVIGRHIWN